MASYNPVLVALATHPIQYQAPIWRGLAERKVPIEVWYLTEHGIQPTRDTGFGQVIQWDLDLLGGYPYRFPPQNELGRLGGFFDLKLPADFRRRLQSGDVKAILIQGWYPWACWQAIAVARRAGVSVWMRGDSNDLKIDPPLKRLVKRLALGSLLHRVDRFLCVGEANRRLYIHYGVPTTRLVEGLHGVENARFARQARRYRPGRDTARHDWGIPEGAYCLVFAGKLISKKRPLDVVAAANRLRVTDPARNYHLLFVGTGPLATQVRDRCRVVFDAEGETRCAARADAEAPTASFTGFLNQTEISKAYVAADALVLPSDAGETWGLVVNEAMASGLPCNASNACGSAEDLVVPLDPRLAYPCGDVDALAASIRHLADHPPAPSAIAQRIARYDLSATVDTLERLWAEIATER